MVPSGVFHVLVHPWKETQASELLPMCRGPIANRLGLPPVRRACLCIFCRLVLGSLCYV